MNADIKFVYVQREHEKEAAYMDVSYPADQVTRQKRDPGCYIKVLFFRLAVYMGQAGDSSPTSRQKKSGSRLYRRVDNCPM